MIPSMFDSGAMPVLERLLQYTGARQRLLADNVANASTPGFRPHDVDPRQFQKALADAIDRRRDSAGGANTPLMLRDTASIAFHDDSIELKPQPGNQNILFHDNNNRDLERTMQGLAENTLMHNAAVDMLRSQFGVLQTAIREKV